MVNVTWNVYIIDGSYLWEDEPCEMSQFLTAVTPFINME